MLHRCNCFCIQVCCLVVIRATLLKAGRPVCPQQGATTITQIKLVPRPKGIAKLRCDFNVPPDPIHPDTGFLYIAWVIDTSNQLYTHLYDPKYNDTGKIQPEYKDLVINVTDNFDHLGRAPGSSTIALDVHLAIKNEFKCEILLNNHQYCVDTTRIQFQEPEITLEADGDVYCQNNGGACREIPSKNHNITCRVKNLDGDSTPMSITVNGIIISNASDVEVLTNSEGYCDGVITASYHVPENAKSSCIVTDARGTYLLTSQPELSAVNPSLVQVWAITAIIIPIPIIFVARLYFKRGNEGCKCHTSNPL